MSRTLSGLRGKLRLLSSSLSKKGPQLALRGESPVSSRVAARFLSSYGGDLRDPLLGPQGDPVSTQVVRGPWGFLCCICRGPCLYLELRSRADMYFGISLGPPEASQGLVSCEPCKSALLSTRKSSYSLPISLTLGNEGFLSRCHRAVTPAIVF